MSELLLFRGGVCVGGVVVIFTVVQSKARNHSGALMVARATSAGFLVAGLLSPIFLLDAVWNQTTPISLTLDVRVHLFIGALGALGMSVVGLRQLLWTPTADVAE